MKKRVIFSVFLSIALIFSTFVSNVSAVSFHFVDFYYFGLSEDETNFQIDWEYTLENIDNIEGIELEVYAKGDGDTDTLVLRCIASEDQIQNQLNVPTNKKGFTTFSFNKDLQKGTNDYWTIDTINENVFSDDWTANAHVWFTVHPKEGGSAYSFGDRYGKCNHYNLDKIVRKDPTCLETGILEHYQCTKKHCAKKFWDVEKDNYISRPEDVIIKATGHSETHIINEKEATHDTDGYTGDEVCVKCNTLIQQGEVIPKLDHDITIINAKEASCKEEGYTGDQYCNDCGEIIKKGTIIPKLAHEVKVINAKEATCESEGYTGDEVCIKCNTLIKQGEVIPKLDHDITIINAKEASCKEEGYTGDQYCNDCGKIIKKGTIIPKLAHEVKVINAKEATYDSEGYTGDKVCAKCGTIIEKGKVIPKLVKDKNAAPETGDSANLEMLFALLGISGFTILHILKKQEA